MSKFVNGLIAFIVLSVTSLFPTISYSLESSLAKNSAPTVLGPIKVITSDPGQPLVYAPIETTQCRIVDRLPGNYEYQLCSSEKGSSIPTCKFLSMIEITRVPGHDETFEIIEQWSLGSDDDSHLTGFHYIQLWDHLGCTLIYADEKMAPTWKGANTYMSDSHTIVLGFHTGFVGLLKKIQDFPPSL